MEKEYLVKQTLKLITEIVIRLINPEFKTPKGGEAIRIITKALDRLEKKCGGLSRQRIVDYVVCTAYAFKNRNKDWKLNQMFGPKSIERYNTDKALKYYEDKWLSTENLTRASLVAIIQDRSSHPKAKFIYMPSEEHTKQRMINQEVGYFLCQTSTLGWSPESESCNMCLFVDKCKSETQKKYPEIYRLRVEHGK